MRNDRCGERGGWFLEATRFCLLLGIGHIPFCILGEKTLKQGMVAENDCGQTSSAEDPGWDERSLFSVTGVNLPSGEGRAADNNKNGHWFGWLYQCLCPAPAENKRFV